MTITLVNGCTATLDDTGRITEIHAPSLELMTPWLARECAELLPARVALGDRKPPPDRPDLRPVWCRGSCDLWLAWGTGGGDQY